MSRTTILCVIQRATMRLAGTRQKYHGTRVQSVPRHSCRESRYCALLSIPRCAWPGRDINVALRGCKAYRDIHVANLDTLHYSAYSDAQGRDATEMSRYKGAKRTATFMSRNTILCVIQHAPVRLAGTRHKCRATRVSSVPRHSCRETRYCALFRMPRCAGLERDINVAVRGCKACHDIHVAKHDTLHYSACPSALGRDAT